MIITRYICHIISELESDPTHGGRHVKFSRVVMFDAITASPWQEGMNLIHLNQID